MKKRIFAFVLFFALYFSGYAQVSMSKKVETVKGRSFYIHSIEKEQTLYSISKAYNVPVDSILKYNPGIKSNLKVGRQMRVPILEVHKANSKGDTLNLVYKVALMLPLYLSEVDSINIGDEDALFNNSFLFIEFYEGFLLALDTLKKQGLSVKLYVYDVTEDTLSALNVTRRKELATMDVIMGPIYGSSFRIVANYAKLHKIKIINPFSSRKEVIKENIHAFKLIPSNAHGYKVLVSYLYENFSGAKIIIVNNRFGSLKKDLSLLQKEIVDYSVAAKMTKLETSVLYVAPDSVEKKLIRYLSKTKPNVVFIHSEDEAFILANISVLNKYKSNYEITVFGLPQCKDYQKEDESIENRKDVADLQDLHFHIFLSSFIDYDSDKVKSFIKKFRQAYKTDPNYYAFCGYDAGYYFLSAFMKFGRSFEEKSLKYNPELLQTRYVFQCTGNDGYENTFFKMYQYFNYKLVEVTKPLVEETEE